MKKKINWKKIGKTLYKSGRYIGKRGSKLAYQIAVNEGRALRKEGGFANLRPNEKAEKHKKQKVKVVYVYPSGKRKIMHKPIKHKKIKRPIRRSDPFNPFGLDF